MRTVALKFSRGEWAKITSEHLSINYHIWIHKGDISGHLHGLMACAGRGTCKSESRNVSGISFYSLFLFCFLSDESSDGNDHWPGMENTCPVPVRTLSPRTANFFLASMRHQHNQQHLERQQQQNQHNHSGKLQCFHDTYSLIRYHQFYMNTRLIMF